MPDLIELLREPEPISPELQRIIDETKAEIAAALHVPRKLQARRRVEKMKEG